jgi:hypothetical protein
MASVLRAAPELRTFHTALLSRGRLHWTNDPAFDGLIHSRLRSIRAIYIGPQLSAGCDSLQQHHFPRLQELVFETMATGDVVFL